MKKRKIYLWGIKWRLSGRGNGGQWIVEEGEPYRAFTKEGAIKQAVKLNRASAPESEQSRITSKYCRAFHRDDKCCQV